MEDTFEMPLQTKSYGRRQFSFVFEPTPERRAQAQNNHGQQSLERLRQRGGMSPGEMLAIAECREWKHIVEAEVWPALRAYGEIREIKNLS